MPPLLVLPLRFLVLVLMLLLLLLLVLLLLLLRTGRKRRPSELGAASDDGPARSSLNCLRSRTGTGASWTGHRVVCRDVQFNEMAPMSTGATGDLLCFVTHGTNSHAYWVAVRLLSAGDRPHPVPRRPNLNVRLAGTQGCAGIPGAVVDWRTAPTSAQVAPRWRPNAAELERFGNPGVLHLQFDSTQSSGGLVETPQARSVFVHRRELQTDWLTRESCSNCTSLLVKCQQAHTDARCQC